MGQGSRQPSLTMLSDSFTSARTTKTSPPWGFFSEDEVYSSYDKSYQKLHSLHHDGRFGFYFACAGYKNELLLHILVVRQHAPSFRWYGRGVFWIYDF